MKTFLSSTSIILIAILFIVIGCSKEDSVKDNQDYKDAASLEEADIILKGGKYDKVITNPLVKIPDCQYIVSGTIEFWLEDELEATIDFGEGECDNLATKTVDGESTEFTLKKKHKKFGKYDKVIVEPLVKTDDCEYIVSGIIQLVDGDKVIVTIDFGDGECDEWATKYWGDKSKVFSMKNWKN